MNVSRFNITLQGNVLYLFGVVMLWLLCDSVVAVTDNSSFTIRPFENNPIAYVEKLGETQIVSRDWNLVVYYNLKNYFDEFKLISDDIADFKGKCNNDTDCTALATTLELRLRGIQEKNEILMNDRNEIRPKRQLLAAIGLGGLAVGGGALYNWLTKSEADDYAKAIEDLKHNQNRMTDLIHQQTSVIELSYDWNKNISEELQKEQHSLGASINALARAEKYGWQLHNDALKHSIMLESYADVQNRIIDAALMVHNGNSRPVLISASKMREHINLISSYLGPEYRLPRTITHVYQMADVKVRLSDDKLIFRITIPVLRASPFQMWRIIPLPYASNQICMKIRPTTEYLLVNDRNESYYDVTETEFKACSEIDDQRICRVRHPSYKFGDTTGRCAMDLIRNATSNHTSCHMQSVPLEEEWKQLTDIHSWIFVLQREKKFNVSCGYFSSMITLTGMGLLYLNGNCSFEGDTMQISTNQLETKMITGYIVSANISTHFNDSHAFLDMPLARMGSPAMDAAMHDLKTNSTGQLINNSFRAMHQYGVIYGFIFVAIVLYGIRHQKKSKADGLNINQILLK